MAESYKPVDYNSVSPYLIVNGAAGTIEFLGRAFSGSEVRRISAPDGRIMHAEVRIGDSIVMLTDGAEGWPAVKSHVHVYVRDVDETYRRALASGGISVQEPVQRGDENKRGAVRDPGGTTWWMATRIG